MSGSGTESPAATSAPAPPGVPPPPGEGATQDEIDRYWLAHVYKPDEPQLTGRAVGAGMLLGGIMSISNLYIGLKIGWSMGMAITSTILAFSVFQSLRKAGLLRTEFSKLENNTVASAASAAGYYCSAGMVSAIPALYLTQQRTLSWIELALWMSAVSFVGVVMAVPMRRQMIDIDRLRFPSGVACAETIRSMHETASEALAKARSLMIGALVAAVVEIPIQIRAFGTARLPGWLRWPDNLHPEKWFSGLTIAGKPLAAYTIALPTSTLLYGAGAIMGIKVGLSMAIGALLLYGVVAPWLASHGVVTVTSEAATYRSVLGWAVWPGVMCALAASLLQFALKWRTIAQAFGSLGKLARSSAKASAMSEVEVPSSWFGWGMLLSTAFVSICAKVMFDIPIWMGVVAVALSFLLAIVACRATGETDVTPIGALGKITQFMYAGIRPGHYATNLMTASITAGSASHSADLLTDLKTGYLLGGSPRRQFIAQFLGIVAGAVFCVPAYMMVARPEKLATPELPSPAAVTWATVADLLAHGISEHDRGPGEAVGTKVQALALSRRPPGAAVGDTLEILSGPAAGRHRVAMLERSKVVLERDVPLGEEGAKARLLAPDGKARGGAEVEVGAAGTLPAARFTRMPAGLQAADHILARVDGRDVWQQVKGLRGDVAVLDHAFALADEGGAPRPVQVKKLSLPPYAILATILAVIFGLVITLFEVYGPKKWRPLLPSVTGLGIAWVITCHDSLAMSIGAVIAYVLAKSAPRIEERYNVSTSSGIIAGASIMGLVIILFRDILKWIS